MIPLDPGRGGRSIAFEALQPADIIVSTTSDGISTAVRVGSLAVVSHAMLYIGDREVIEAIKQGVVRRRLTEAVADAVLATAYRHPRVTKAAEERICAVARELVGRPYAIRGALLATDPILCRVVGSAEGSFFCSQLVLHSYQQAGLPLSGTPPECMTPGAIVEIAQDRLYYVGHLKARDRALAWVAP